MVSEISVSSDESRGNGANRFFTYLREVQASEPLRTGWYPGLSRKPWYDPQEFSIARELESRFSEIKREALNVKPDYYFEEAENVARTGSWQVCILYEQGRKNESVCIQCPVTTAILDGSKSVRKTAGLTYFSKMDPRTQVAAHQGQSNIRLRCHLALSIPIGDCAIRVDNQIHPWTEGKCIIFDDTFEHEVWNRTDEARLVLLVDLWHPDLTDLERDALDCINRLSFKKAMSMKNDWERNDSQRAREGRIAVNESDRN